MSTQLDNSRYNRTVRYFLAAFITLLAAIVLFPSTVVPTPAHALTATVTPSLVIRLHYKGWANPKLYAWTGTNTPLFGAWPGIAMAAENSNGWYLHTVTGYSNINLIFNNGNSQTPDLTRGIGEWWYYNNQWYSSNPEATPTPTYTPTPTAIPTGVPINFSLTISPTAGGEALLGTVYVVGSIPALGSWNPDLAIQLNTNPYPVWKTTINVPANTFFEYKYIQKKNGTVIWDVNPNHTFTSPEMGWATVNDIWGISGVATPTPTPIGVAPDLVVTFARWGSELEPGFSCWQPGRLLPTGHVTIANQGNAAANSFAVSFGGKTQTVSGLAAGQSTSVAFVEVPSSPAPIVDVNNEVVESNENNNVFTNPIFTITATPPPRCTPTGTPTPTYTPTPSVTPTPTVGINTVVVTFNANVTTVMGENVYVVGNIPALGSWNTAAAIPLSSASYPIWQATINLPANTAVEYKYIKKNGTAVTWESFANNRAFTTAASGSMTRNETWNVWQ